MDYWSKSRSVFFKCHRSHLREEPFVGQSDEDQNTDNEICTIVSRKFDSGGENSASRCGSDETEETLTVDDILETIGFGKFHWKLSFLVGFAWTGEAMEMMILSILGPQLHCEWRLPSYKMAVILSVVFLGMVMSAPGWGYVSDNYGRRVCLIICISWILFYGLLSTFSPGYGWLLVLRGLVGIGIGGNSQSTILYSEFLSFKKRGTCIIMMSFFWSGGAVFIVFIALWVMPTFGWRWLLGVSTLPLAIFVCFTFWLPESPRFDLLTGNTERAMVTLQRVARENGKTMPQGKVIAHKQKDRGQIKDLFSPEYRRTTLLLWFIWFAIAFCYYGIVFLTTELFQSGDSCEASQGANLEPSCSLECNYLTSTDYNDLLWTTFAEIPGVFGALLMVERIGRKKSLALCFFMFSLFILPLYACIGRIPLTIFIFIARAFITGGYQVVNLYTPEVFPTENRALAMGTCSSMAKVGSLISPFVSQVMIRKSIYLTLSVFCGCSLLAVFMPLILPSETLGKRLQESSLNKEAGVQTTAMSQTHHRLTKRSKNN
ncbi:synaptic vesicle 2-related protein-like isoform X2 [Antennarius striatus]|uniref:synaptic vesicle 2-related protein-like isoform X2 n=1 Tax=Antennarius striatus TaxID=241820 RepID=UPI0035AE8084